MLPEQKCAVSLARFDAWGFEVSDGVTHTQKRDVQLLVVPLQFLVEYLRLSFVRFVEL